MSDLIGEPVCQLPVLQSSAFRANHLARRRHNNLWRLGGGKLLPVESITSIDAGAGDSPTWSASVAEKQTCREKKTN